MAGGGFVEAAATAGPGGGGDGGDSRPRLSSTARAAAAAAAAAASRLGRSGPWRRVAGAGEGGVRQGLAAARAGAPAGPEAAAGRSGPRRLLGWGERAAPAPVPGRREGGQAGVAASPWSGPRGLAREGLPGQPQNKNRAWGVGRIPKTHRDPL